MTTALDLISDALLMNGTLAEGESPTAEMAQDSLNALNMMLDAWSIENLAVYSTQTQSFTWPASTASRTVGPTGDFVGTRPVSIEPASYFEDSNGEPYKFLLISEEEYNGISAKTATGSYPEYMFVNMTNPDAAMYVYPVPSSNLTLKLVSVVELSQPATLQTALAFPPGYLRAFKFNLAVEIAAMDGAEPLPTVGRIAISSKKSIKRLNTSRLSMKAALPAAVITSGIKSDIFTG
ncbi:hypothetical protein [Sulfurovum sp.]|uniref:hypothetical protein n=1 Tax=Sulfurovum sp. TaxID=1969726 RepID=UPI0035658D43